MGLQTSIQYNNLEAIKEEKDLIDFQDKIRSLQFKQEYEES